MKTTIITLSGILLLFLCTSASAQDIKKSDQKTFTFDSPDAENTLHLYNVSGNVEVAVHNNSDVRVEVEQLFWGEDQQSAAELAEEIRIVYEKNGNHILIYLDAPFIHVKRYKNKPYAISYNMNNWQHYWEDDTDYAFHFTVTVPVNTHLELSTINNGEVSVTGAQGSLKTRNVNGGIHLEGISGTTTARTVNGTIHASYKRVDFSDSKYKTINGDINVYFPEDLSADIKFESLNGDLYTDFENIKYLPSQIASTKSGKKSGTKYKIDAFTPIRIASGGKTLSFEVLNGNVYVQKKNL